MTLLQIEQASKEFRLDWVRTSFIKRSEKLLRHGRKHEVRRVVDNVSFQVTEGQRWGVIGRNGSGKTTLLKMASGIIRPSSGHIERFVPAISLFSFAIGLADELDVIDNIFLIGAIMGMPRVEMRKKFDAIVEFSELSAHLGTRFRTLSDGMRARIFISVALHAPARLFIFDESLSALDIQFQEKCHKVLLKLCGEGCGVIFTAHQETLLRRFTEHALLLEEGKIVAQGPVDLILDRYSTRSKSAS